MLRSPTFWLIVSVGTMLIVGSLLLTDYGESWDEYNFFQYAQESLAAYRGVFTPGFRLTFSDPTLRHYGAWFWMLCVLIARFFPRAYISDVAHGLTFLTFQLGVLGMYLLARRWLKPWTALVLALSFATQPLLWGHAFLNERDIPFLVGFIWTMYLGFQVKDHLPIYSPRPAVYDEDWLQDWRALRLRWRAGLIALWGVGVIFGMWGCVNLTQVWLKQAPLVADTTFAHDLDLYLRPILSKFWGGALGFSLTLLWAALVFLPFLPRLRQRLWRAEIQPLLHSIRLALCSPRFLAAMVVLGLTAGIRIVGWLAAGIVLWFWYRRAGWRVFPWLVPYVAGGFLVMYLGWPYLWPEPLLRFLITFRLMLRFPWPGQVLFMGKFYAGNQVPRLYLPMLNAVQLTEPLLLFSLAGLVICSGLIRRWKPCGEFRTLVLFWYGLPVVLTIVGRPYLYDNFRQFLFVLPPLFLLAGLSIERVRERWPRWGVLLCLILFLLPGLWNLVSLHPYQYIYYNSLVGGVGGAFRRYEMDYWGTSFRAAADYLNAYAPPGAQVVVWGPPTTFWRYARPDISVYNSLEAGRPQDNFYALISTRSNKDLEVYPDLPILYQVERAGAILTVIRYVP